MFKDFHRRPADIFPIVSIGSERLSIGSERISVDFLSRFLQILHRLSIGFYRCSIHQLEISPFQKLILVGGLEHVLFSHILGMSSSQLTFIFFRGVGQPPTSEFCDFTPETSGDLLRFTASSGCWGHQADPQDVGRARAQHQDYLDTRKWMEDDGSGSKTAWHCSQNIHDSRTN